MKIQDNILANIKREYLSDLRSFYNVNEAEQLLTILIEYYFGVSRIQLKMKPDIRLSESEIIKLHMSVKDLKKYKPVQYIIGVTEFHDLKFKVTPDVLIPRPETEELVQLIANTEKSNKLTVLDIGTGSGCIAISLSKLLNTPTIHASDISKAAINVAQNNATANKLKVQFHNHDILNTNQPICDNQGNPIQFDIIVSNPPYVTQTDKKQMQPNVLDYEPHNALFVSNENPLKYYDAIIQFASKQLSSGGRLYFEINENLGNEMLTLLKNLNYTNIKITKDLSNRDRFIWGIKI